MSIMFGELSGRVDVLAPVVPYSSEVQQPMRTTATLGTHPHTH